MQEMQVWSLGQDYPLEVRNGSPLQYSCLGNPMDREAWWATVHGLAGIRPNWVTEHTHALSWAVQRGEQLTREPRSGEGVLSWGTSQAHKTEQVLREQRLRIFCSRVGSSEIKERRGLGASELLPFTCPSRWNDNILEWSLLAEALVPSQQPWTCCGWFSNDIPRRHGSPRGDPRPPREGPDHASAATCGQPAHTCLSILVRQTGAQGTEAQNEPCLPVERKNKSKNWSRQQPRSLPWKVTGRTHLHGSSTGVSPSGVSPEHSADPSTVQTTVSGLQIRAWGRMEFESPACQAIKRRQTQFGSFTLAEEEMKSVWISEGFRLHGKYRDEHTHTCSRNLGLGRGNETLYRLWKLVGVAQ